MKRLDAIPGRSQFEEILQQALALPADQRAMLVDHLLHSLNALTHDEIDQAWAEEIERRVREIDEGKVELIPGVRSSRLTGTE